MRNLSKSWLFNFCVVALLGACSNGSDNPVLPADDGPIEALLFTRTQGFRHPSIPDAVEFFTTLAPAEKIHVTHTEDAQEFSDGGLARYDVVIFANTTGDVLDDAQQSALQRFISAGGGYVGIHSAADTEHDWPWYGQLVGAYFISHPLLPVDVEVTTEDGTHPSTQHLPATFQFTDEIYNFDRNPRRDHSILLTVDEAGFSYPNFPETPSMGDDHPIAWYKEFAGGRSFYTNLGHRPESWRDPLFQQHVLAGVKWAAASIGYSRVILTNEAANPMELAVADDGRVFYIERTGELRVWLPDTGQVMDAGVLDVDTTSENGLLGLTLDPDFAHNAKLYLYYSLPTQDPPPDGAPGRNILASFQLNADNTLDMGSRQQLLEVPSDRACCHEGGSLAFAPDGSLFVSVGDNTNPFPAEGYAPLDERPGHERENSQRTAQNPFDLRGKILRINPDGSIPEGNLFPRDGSQGRPEIYIMGDRNPFRIAVDPNSGRLYWGEVGPDASVDDPRGPRGYDEINFADHPGNYGWPYCIGANRPYSIYNFDSGEVGAPFSCANYQPALLAYDYHTVTVLALGNATDPETGFRGRTAIAGTVYATPEDARFKLPEVFHNKLLMTDWTRDVIAAVEVTDEGQLGAVTRLLPWERFRRPIDLDVGPDGALYVLEYGSSFGGDNPDAQVSRIEYSESVELTPVATVSSSTSAGIVPLKVDFSSAGSRAPGRGNSITAYEWDFNGDGNIDSREANPSYTYESPGLYRVSLAIVTSAGGRSLPSATNIVVGNTPPVVEILSPEDNITMEIGSVVQLRGTASDLQDAGIDCSKLVWDVRLGHNAHSHPNTRRWGCEASIPASLGGHNEQGALFLVVELTYTDTGGPDGEPALTGRDSIRINVK